MNKPSWQFVLAAACLVIGLSGCTPVARPEQPSRTDWQVISPDTTLGQTFIANFAGLSAIDLFLQPEENPDGSLNLAVYSGPDEGGAITTSSLPAEQVTTPGFYRFEFPALAGSTRESFYLELSHTGNGAAAAGIAAPESYLDGALYLNGTPVNRQLTFLLGYDAAQMGLGLAGEFLQWGLLLAAAAWLYILPGWGLAGWLWRGWHEARWQVKLAAAAGTSLALYPLLFLWLDVVNLQVGKASAWLLPLFGLVLVLWRNRAWRPEKRFFQTAIQNVRAADLTFVALIVLLAGSRFWVIRNLAAPMFGDSYQHTMVVQLFLDHGGLFQSWQPYASLDLFTYHFGFHANAAVFAWLTGFSASEAVLWFGQILNILAVLVLVPLAIKIGKSPWAGVAAVLVAGLIVQMPAYYVNWGRYPQLAGLTILPICVYFAWKLVAAERLDWQVLGINWILAGGLALTHYRVVILAVLFLPACWLLVVRRATIKTAFANTLLYGFGAGLLVLPWYLNLTRGNILNILNNQLSTPAQAVPAWQEAYNSIGDLSQYLPLWVWLGLIFCSGALLWLRSKSAAVVQLWWFFNLLATNPAWLGLPGTGTISNFTLFISAYIPAGILIGGFLGETAGHLSEWKRGEVRVSWVRTLSTLLLLGGGLLALWGFSARMEDAQPAEYALVTHPDVRAANWLLANTGTGDRFLVNAFKAFNDSEVVGSDAGWWLPLLASRQTFLYPLNAGFEQESSATGSVDGQIVDAIQDFGIDDPRVLDLLASQGLTHVFIGQQNGSVNSDSPLLEVEDLLRSPDYIPVYHQDRIWIFKILASPQASLP